MTETAPRKIILDCDPGYDDAAAIMLAAGSPGLEVLAITTVAGNQTIGKVTNNALRIARMAGLKDIPVARGAVRPLLRPAVAVASQIHGETGLDGVDLPEATLPLDPRPAAQVIVDIIMREPEGTVTLVPTGPLTNIAIAARLEPRIVSRVREVVLMGGAWREGNATPCAEFNIENDPEAAQIVFSESWKVTMVGLDLTYQARASEEVRERIRAVGNPSSKCLWQILEMFAENYRVWRGFDSPPLHDPCAVAYVLDPTLLEVRAAPISVETHGTLTYGMTVADLRGPAPEGCNTFVALRIDVDRFWDLMVRAVEHLG
ncbi:nucleoside hydrolase [Sutterella sp.]|uniref:nucleoside hydrolase n=1 Tax=Sutterella sp. TaxID=1981025 RepID=UPI0026E03F5A|nr:nucleoside hydrolase [Sutterella sp.]MDO5532307.1 nucleoside hydrolase [Sutterella sp.]